MTTTFTLTNTSAEGHEIEIVNQGGTVVQNLTPGQTSESCVVYGDQSFTVREKAQAADAPAGDAQSGEGEAKTEGGESAA